MNIAVLGDIHGNHLALQAVLAAARALNVEKLLITGDLVGYYPFVKETLELLDPWHCEMVKGNHEVMLEIAMSDQNYLHQITERYGSSVRIALETLDDVQINTLVNLPETLNLDFKNFSATICHGSPVAVDEYIYPDCDTSTLPWLDSVTTDMIICGHTHYPMLLDCRGKKILNPGSVGQSRNGIRKAHWVFYDEEENHFEFKVEDYDAAAIIAAVRKYDPSNEYLVRVLST